MASDQKPLLDLSDNPAQKSFIFSPAKYTGYYGGIRNGKSYGGCYRGIFLNETFPGNVGLVGRLTYPELWDTTEKIYLDFVRKRNGGTLDNSGNGYVRSFNQTKNILEIYNGSLTYFRYLQNVEAILSLTLGWFYVDQAEFISEEMYEHLEGRLSLWSPDRKKDTRKAYKKLHNKELPYEPAEFGFITGNPAPGWVHRRYKLGLNKEGKPFTADGGENPYRLIEAGTEANKRNLPEEYLADLKRTMTDEWIERYLAGSWETFAGQIYKEFERRLHVIKLKDLPTDKGGACPPAHWPRFLGWDHGTTNPTAVCFVCVDEDGNAVVYNEHYKVSSVIKDHADAVLGLCVGDSVPRAPDGKGVIVHIDSAISGDHDPQGRDFKQLYEELGIFSINANKQVLAGIQKVASLLHPDPEHKFPAWHPRAGQKGAPRLYFVEERCPAGLHELPLYEWEPIPEGAKLNQKERPRKYLDHFCDALRYAVMAIFERAMSRAKDETPSYGQYVLAEILGINADLKAQAGIVTQGEADNSIWD